jgi:hypothetical protein
MIRDVSPCEAEAVLAAKEIAVNRYVMKLSADWIY